MRASFWVYTVFFTTNILSAWHLSDISIGLKKTKYDNSNKSLAWNFFLWDLAPKKGLNVNLSILDTGRSANRFNLGDFAESSLKFKREEGSLEFDQNQGRASNHRFKKMDFRDKNFKTHADVSIDCIKQIAPNATITLYPVFDNNGEGQRDLILKTLKSLQKDSLDILCLFFKFNKDFPELIHEIEILLKQFPFIIAPIGNNGINLLSYPGRSNKVLFDIGSYDSNHKICSFSQYSYLKGPTFVLPGFSIMSNKESFSGTSLSAALAAGLLALVLGEYKNEFSIKQIVSTLYRSAYKNEKYGEKVVLGMLDVRTTLFCLLVLKKYKAKIPLKQFEQEFDHMVESLIWLVKLNNKGLMSFRSDVVFLNFVKNLFNYAQKNSLKKCINSCVHFLNIVYDKPSALYMKKKFDNCTIQLIKDTIVGHQRDSINISVKYKESY